MYLGTALALIAIGAILLFAWQGEDVIAGLSLSVVGIILILIGLIGAIFELAVRRPRRTTTSSGTREVVRERDVR